MPKSDRPPENVQHRIERRYAKHDEAGTPFCITVDHQTPQDDSITIRYRDTTFQERISVDRAVDAIQERLR